MGQGKMPTHNAVLLGAIFFLLTREGTALSDANGPDSLQNSRTSPRYMAARPSQQRGFCSRGLGGCGRKIDVATQWAKSFGGRRESRAAQWLKPVQKRRSEK